MEREKHLLAHHQDQVTFRNANRREFELEGDAMNDDEIARLAALGNAIRPDWPIASLRTFIAKHLTSRGYGDTAVALTWIATKTNTQTPRLILEPGIWWQAALSDGDHAPRREPYDPSTHCGVCSQPEHRCRNNEHNGHEFVTAIDTIRNARRNQETR